MKIVSIFEGSLFAICYGDGAINDDFGCGQVSCFGVDFKGVVNFVPPYCESDAAWVRFHWTVRYY